MTKILLLIFWIALAVLVAANHPANPNKLCARPGCGHYHTFHSKANGPCEYASPEAPAGHCLGWLK